jgi:hypothetical protein
VTKNFIHEKDYGPLIGISTLAAFIASLCCITPIVLVLFGLTSVSFATALDQNLDTKYEALFILIGMITLFLSIWIYQKKLGFFGLTNQKQTRLVNYFIIGMVLFVTFYLIIHNLIGYNLEQRLGIWGTENIYFGYKP